MAKIATRVRRKVRRAKWRATPTFLKQRRLRKDMGRAEGRYDALINGASDRMERGRLEHEASVEMTYRYLEIQEMDSDRVIRQANKLRIPRPGRDDEESWENNAYNDPRVGDRILTTTVIDNLEKRITEKRTGRRQVYKDWVLIFAAIAGFVSAIFF